MVLVFLANVGLCWVPLAEFISENDSVLVGSPIKLASNKFSLKTAQISLKESKKKGWAGMALEDSIRLVKGDY